MKVICIKEVKNFIVDKSYKYELNSGIIFMPYLPKDDINIISNSGYSPKKLIKSRYSKVVVKNSNYEEIKIKGDRNPINTYKVFYDETDVEIFNEKEFRKHFATLKEYRKLKLQKLNEHNS